MNDLKRLREQWNEIRTKDTQLLREMTASEGLRIFAVLYDAFSSRFRDEEPSYLPERERTLIARQRRLARLAQWLEDHPGESPLQGPLAASRKTD